MTQVYRPEWVVLRLFYGPKGRGNGNVRTTCTLGPPRLRNPSGGLDGLFDFLIDDTYQKK